MQAKNFFMGLREFVDFYLPLGLALVGVSLMCIAPYLALKYPHTDSLLVFVTLIVMGGIFLSVGAFFLRRSK